MSRGRVAGLILLSACLLVNSGTGQYRRGGRGGRGWRQPPRMVPQWETDPAFPADVFTFVRIRYGSWWGRSRWATDYPDSDLNFSFRLQQLTSLEVDPEPKVIELTEGKSRPGIRVRVGPGVTGNRLDHNKIAGCEVGIEMTAAEGASDEANVVSGNDLLRNGTGLASDAPGVTAIWNTFFEATRSPPETVVEGDLALLDDRPPPGP